MSAQDILLTFIVIALLSVVVTAANYAEKRNNPQTRQAVFGILVLFNILIVISSLMQVGAAYTSSADAPGKGAAWGALLASLLTSGLASLLLFSPVRHKLVILFPRYQKRKRLPELEIDTVPFSTDLISDLQPKPGNIPLFPQMLNYYTADSFIVLRPAMTGQGESASVDEMGVSDDGSGFNPASIMHMVALVLCVYMLGLQTINFILGGGIEGVADSYKGGLTAWDILINGLPFVVIPVLGVGLGVRRGGRQILRRLGLGMPTVEGIAVSAVATIVLFVFVVIVASLWMGLVSKATYEEQTKASDAISKSISTLGLAFCVAVTAAVGEEIAFRGALQPVFGLWPTAIIFALSHAQYTLTPAALIILGVALAFGWLRHRYNTTVSMLTHFFYDFIPLAIGVTTSSGVLVWLLRLI